MNSAFHFPRRNFLRMLAVTGAAAARPSNPAPLKRKMTINLMPGMIGVRANQRQAVELAHRHGFESVEPIVHELAGLSLAQMDELKAFMGEKRIHFGAASVPVEFRRDDARFQEDLNALPRLADGLERAGVSRAGTWLPPGSNTLTYPRHFKLCEQRLREIARVLGQRNIRFGLEYVGPKTSRDRHRFHFVHTMAEARELIAAIGEPNMGLVLDSWHWWNAEDTVADILNLRGEEVIAVDLNDAPAGLPKDKQIDNQRELPLATGVIDLKSFLGALVQIGCDAPVRAEPFNKALNDLDNDAACAKAAAALRKAFDLIS